MSAGGKRIQEDAGRLPLASFYNEGADAHEPIKGAGGAMRHRVADGDHVAFGARDDAPSSGDLTGDFSLVSLTKEFVTLLRTLTG